MPAFRSRRIKPWAWQDALGFAQAVEVPATGRVLHCSGQAALDDEGRPVPGDMRAQVRLSLDNLAEVLAGAGYTWGDVVRLTYYTTNATEFLASYDELTTRLAGTGCVPACTLLQVAGLAYPELRIEIEATAVRGDPGGT